MEKQNNIPAAPLALLLGADEHNGRVEETKLDMIKKSINAEGENHPPSHKHATSLFDYSVRWNLNNGEVKDWWEYSSLLDMELDLMRKNIRNKI